MLDTETRHRIDTARDILVGKVPDPKSQVEQITIALIYKFMDDMDADSEELGGKRKFFAGKYAHYGWAKLLHAGLGGHEMLNLYAEAITKMPENPGIPSLFRDIFKNAYLPYRDPETLKSFLKIIDDFSYDHSERLGDAFEYLLSVLGAQGDAGQFRTPRHIIDFMVEVVDPKKTDIVLDPACGTAGFLISSWKHILKANTNAKGHSTLTPDDRERLAKNFIGYDISPDMVRLSLVNLYLHGFADPHISEYDTLTSQEHWNAYADVILANPPFMSPKGGIKPHNRFSVQSKRSEVLFVDYMAEHLSANGRAGIIVPEGVIFQSQTSYKKLRKILVEQSLVAVISLPAGLFQPYSGVKTSILILDKSLAKKSQSIGFFKITNDGFGLGAQRRPIEQNDMPQALVEIGEYLRRLRAGESPEGFQPTLGLIVDRRKVAADGGYNLSGERYREGAVVASNWPMVALKEIIDELESGVSVNSTRRTAGTGEVGILKTSCVTSGIFDSEEHKAVLPDEISRVRCSVKRDSIIISRMNTESLVGANAYVERDHEHLFLPDRLWQTVISRPDVLVRYIQHVLASPECRSRISAKCGGTSGSMKNIAKPSLLSIQIPLPPLDVQNQIVAEIDSYQKVIDGARTVLDNYRPHISVHPAWPMVTIGELCERIQYGLSTPLRRGGAGFKTFRMNELVEGRCVDRGDMKCTDITIKEFTKYRLTRGDLLFNRTNSFEHVGRTGLFDLTGDYCFASYLIRLSVAEGKANPFFVNAFMNSNSFQKGIKQFASRAIGQSNINAKNLAAYRIPLPPLATQQAIVAEIEAEQALVNANRELIARFEKKIAAALARIWGDEEALP